LACRNRRSKRGESSRAVGGGLRRSDGRQRLGGFLVAIDRQSIGIEEKPADRATLWGVLLSEAQVRNVEQTVGHIEAERAGDVAGVKEWATAQVQQQFGSLLDVVDEKVSELLPGRL